MPVKLKVEPVRNGTMIVTANFYDEDNLLLTTALTSLDWTLTRSDGTAINNRVNVSIATPTSPVIVRLTGDDLAVTGKTDLKRELLFQGLYDSNNGSDNSLRERATFDIEYSFGENA